MLSSSSRPCSPKLFVDRAAEVRTNVAETEVISRTKSLKRGVQGLTACQTVGDDEGTSGTGISRRGRKERRHCSIWTAGTQIWGSASPESLCQVSSSTLTTSLRLTLILLTPIHMCKKLTSKYLTIRLSVGADGPHLRASFSAFSPERLNQN